MTLLSSEFLLHALAVFVGVALLDIMWAWYIQHTAQNDAWRASLTAVGLTVFGAGLTLEYVHNRWLLIPAGLGAFAGTFIPLKLHAKNQPPTEAKSRRDEENDSLQSV